MPPEAPTTPRVLIDPRIRRRRIEVRRDQGRRRLRFLVVGAIVIGLSAAAWLAVRSPLLDIDRIQVEGAVRTPAVGIVHASGLRTHTAMIHVDEAAAARRVEGLPWVLHAEVHRRWPGTVQIRVTERTATAVTSPDGNVWAVLDASGRVLDRAPAAPPGLPRIDGVGPVGEPGTTVANASGPLAVIAALSPALRARTVAVAAVAGQVELRLTPTGIIRLGPPDDLGTKLRAAERVLAQVDTRGLAVLDVRLPASPVLTRG